MITSKQRTEGCIALNKLKLLISEAAYIYDLKSLYTAIETGIDTAAAEAAAASATPSGGATDGTDTDDEDSGSSLFGGGTNDAATVTLTPCTNISVTWLETKLTELKDEIESTLTEIRKQIKNNI